MMINSYDENRLLTTKEAAEYLRYRPSYIYNLVCKGVLKPYKCGNKRQGSLRFEKGELDRFLGRKKYVNKKAR